MKINSIVKGVFYKNGNQIKVDYRFFIVYNKEEFDIKYKNKKEYG